VIVSIKPNETLLCLAHLPFHLTDQDLRKFACQFGIIEKCFLMRNEGTGKGKVLGIVAFFGFSPIFKSRKRIQFNEYPKKEMYQAKEYGFYFQIQLLTFSV
jgi:hypothetical protein